jgi:arylsulfatase A-like enzyme
MSAAAAHLVLPLMFLCRLPLVVSLGLALVSPASPGLAAPAPARPNILLIIADDLGCGDLGSYGAKVIPTPHLDRLAREGLRFTQAYAPSATCTPSRYALLTGEYPWRQPPRKTSILDGDAPLALDPARPTLASFLRGQGYATGLVGKWHLGLGDGVAPIDFNGRISPGPLEVGFQEAFFIPATVDRVPCVFIDGHRVAGLDPADPLAVSYLKRIGEDPVGHERPDLLKYPADRQHADTIVNGISRIGHMGGGRRARWVDEDIADVLTRRAVDFIARHRTRPFFLSLGLHDPHVPRMPHPRFRGQSGAGIRGDTIVQIDWVIGELLAALARHGLERNTLILFTSDNGPVLFDGYFDGAAEANGEHRPAGGLRGWKYLRYEGGTRVPLLARWPGTVPAGVTTDALFSLHDLFATTAALLEKPLPAGAGRDGLDLSTVLRGRTPAEPRTSIVQHGIGNVLALRAGDWKYIPANADTASGIGRGADPRDRRFAEAAVPEPLLFNLAADPGETTNLAQKHPEKVRELAAQLDAIRAGTRRQ